MLEPFDGERHGLPRAAEGQNVEKREVVVQRGAGQARGGREAFPAGEGIQILPNHRLLNRSIESDGPSGRGRLRVGAQQTEVVDDVAASQDKHATPVDHVNLAQRLAPLRDEGVLILGSGNVVHNLGLLSADPQAPPPAWAIAFDGAVQEAVVWENLDALTRWESLTPAARLACPSLDHYLPLLYVLALRRPGEPVSFPVEGFQHGTISMRAVRVG
jgi:hypothetical protein